jgi:ABC-type polysaccharide/polyol phosphate export permease
VGTATSVALKDLGGSVIRLPLAFVLALNDINGKYKRTVLGPLWIVLGQAATIAAFLIVFAGLFGLDPRYYAIYLAAGFPVWVLISSFLAEMPQSFIAARGMIESFEIPWITHVWRRSFGYVLVFFHQILTLFVGMAVLGEPFSPNMLWALPALLVVVTAGTGMGMMLAVFGARYRDLQPAMAIVAGFLFLFSPVIWRAEQLQVNEWALKYNPVYYVIKLLRDPLLGHAPSLDLWLGASAAAVALFALGFAVFASSRRRLYHWL